MNIFQRFSKFINRTFSGLPEWLRTIIILDWLSGNSSNGGCNRFYDHDYGHDNSYSPTLPDDDYCDSGYYDSSCGFDPYEYDDDF